MVKFFILLIIGLIVIYVISTIDTQTNVYNNKYEVISDGAIKRGWIPNIIPDSSYEIINTHNIDTNEIAGSFKYLEKDENTFLNYLEKHNNKLLWENFEFTIDKKSNKVQFFGLYKGLGDSRYLKKHNNDSKSNKN